MSFKEAKKYIPGGVNSPVRAFKSVDLDPIFIKRGLGSKIYDIDGKEYVDFVCSWGPLILGHAHPQIISAIKKALDLGTSFGACTPLEIKMAKLITAALPSIEKVRMVSSGTESVMSAIRLARGYTKRDKIIKFEGCYHGHADSLLVKAGSGAATYGAPDSAGIPECLAKLTITVPYNDLEAVKKVLNESVAAVIVEPVAGNMGVVLPKDGFLEGLSKLTKEQGALLIFDEVITGFRLCYGGAQTIFDIKPDITCLGKIIGGGLPVGAYGGRADIMDYLSPDGPVYQAGTLSGNPIALTAGIETLKILRDKYIYEDLDKKGKKIEDGLKGFNINRIGSMFTIFFSDKKVVDYNSAKTSDTIKFSRFFKSTIDAGIYIPPSQFESMFISAAHTEEDVQYFISKASKFLPQK